MYSDLLPARRTLKIAKNTFPSAFVLLNHPIPMVLPDHHNVQSFGITTLNDGLTMTLTSRWPVEGLPDAVKEILQQA